MFNKNFKVDMFFPGFMMRPVALAVFSMSFASVQAQVSALIQTDKLGAEKELLEAATLPDVEVKADALIQRIYTREQMDVTPQSNRDLAGLIADHPSLRPVTDESGAGNKGSLAPESFSIHGESPYQNQFQIDGISATNVIKPHERNTLVNGGYDAMESYSQSYNLDTDLLDQVEVYDSRVPIEFSGFTGGVIDAKIMKPLGSGRWQVKRSFNSSNLTKQELPEEALDVYKERWENGNAGFSSTWKKHFSSVSGDMRLNDTTNALVSFSRRESQIQRQQTTLKPGATDLNVANLVRQDSTQNDTVDNLMAKVHTRIGDAQASVLLKYADRREDLVSNAANYLNVGWAFRQQSFGLSGEWLQPMSSGVLSLKAGIDHMNSLREDEEDEFAVEYNAPGGLYSHGGYGDAALAQTQYSLKLRHDWTLLQIGSVTHKLYAGLDAQNTHASFERQRDIGVSQYRYRTVGGRTERYLYQHTNYAAGNIETDNNSVGGYVSHAMQWRNWELSSAARWDRNDFLKRTNFSPRVGLDWDLNGDGDGDGDAKVGLGWSRYYGIDMLGYALEQGKAQLGTYVMQGGVTVNKPASTATHNYGDLKTPYSDEWAISYTQKISSALLSKAQYVHRISRDAVTQRKLAGNSFYDNGGRSQSESVMLGLHLAKPLKWVSASWTAGIDFSWQATQRNYQSNAGWEAYDGDEEDIITVDGVKMQRKDKPVSEFALPRRVNAAWSANWANVGVTWGNRLNWNDSRTGLALLNAGIGGATESYRTKKLPSYWTWDTTVQYQPRSLKGATFTVEVLNVLNQIRPLSVVSNSGGATRMQVGREIWLNASYEF